MRKLFSASPLALCVLGGLILSGCSANGLSGLTGDLPVDPAPQTQHANGVVEDWSTSHVVYPLVGEVNSLIAVQNDPRAIQAWQAAAKRQAQGPRVPPRFLPIQSDAHRDWTVSLGGGSVGPAMYPAKFSFDTSNAALTTANCTSDFAVFPVDVAGGPTQPNIVGLDNLYSGTIPTNGLCNRTVNPPTDDGVSATTLWSYNITAGGGIVATSPALSLDGTKVAFVETGGGAAHFHVLAWKAGDGVDTTTPDAQNVLLPKSITSGFATLAPTAGSGTVTDLALSGANDTLSSPFIDYTNDLAYVGNDAGVIFRIKNAFCTTAACTPGVSGAPTLDASWGTAGALTIGGTCSGPLSGVVVDGGTGHVFVGCADGKLYGFTNTGGALATASVAVGNSTTFGAIIDPPLIDAVNKLVYAVAGSSATSGPEVVAQASTVDLSALVVTALGPGGLINMHDPAFNDAYLTGSGTALLYDWGLNNTGGSGAGSEIALFGVTFSGHVMQTTGTNELDGLGSSTTGLTGFSPVTEFDNGGTDQLFVSGLVNASPNFLEYNINSFPATFPPSGAAGTTLATGQGSGTSGIIVDNQSSASQASSVYFGVSSPGTNANTAGKLTQSGLN